MLKACHAMSTRQEIESVMCCRAAGKGRGLVVTHDVKAGHLLAVNNPLAVASVNRRDFGCHLDEHTKLAVSPLKLEILAQLQTQQP